MSGDQSTQENWENIDVLNTIGNSLSICDYNNIVILSYIYTDEKYSFLYVSNDNGYNWTNILVNLSEEFTSPGITFLAIGYDTNKQVYQIFTVILYTSDNLNYTVYVNYASCINSSDVTTPSKWTWTNVDTSPSSNNSVYGAMSYSGNSFFVSNTNPNNDIGSYIKFYDASSTNIVSYTIVDDTLNSLQYNGLTCSGDGYYLCYFGQFTDNQYYIYYNNTDNIKSGTQSIKLITTDTSIEIIAAGVTNYVEAYKNPIIVYCANIVKTIYYCTDGYEFSDFPSPLSVQFTNLVVSNDCNICLTTNTSIYTGSLINGNFSQQNSNCSFTGGDVKISFTSGFQNLMYSGLGAIVLFLTNLIPIPKPHSSSFRSNIDNKKNTKKKIKTIKSTPFICGLTKIDSLGHLSLGGNLTLRDPNTSVYAYNSYQSLNQNDMTNITSNKCGLKLINKLNSVTYKLLTDYTDITYNGFTPENLSLATKETNCVLNLVQYNEDGVSSINTNAFISPIVCSIQELDKDVTLIKEFIKNTTKTIKNLKCQVKKLKKQNKKFKVLLKK